MDKISRAINSIESGRLFSYKNENLDSIVWYDLDTKSAISKEDIQTAMDSLDNAESTKKASGKQKLLDLGLTEEEVKALTGV